jgi:exodeoxyribonuclease V beta subunit
MTPRELDLLTCPLDGISLIEASAGTGKTWHVCALVLRLLLERGLEVQQLLVVTFTNAATAELRERVRERLVETLAVLQGGEHAPGDGYVPALLHSLHRRHGLDEATLARRVALALQSFDEAAIFTIHGFCQRALAELPLATGSPMALTPLADDGPLLLQAVNEFWRRHVAGDALDPPLAAYLAALKDTPEKYAALLARRLRQPLSPCLWPAALDVGDPAPDAPLAQAYAAARACWQAEAPAIAQALREAAPHLNAASYAAPSIVTALAGWRRWMLADDALAPLDEHGDKLALLGAATLAQRTRARAAPPAHRFFALAQALLEARRAAEGRLEIARLRLLRQLFDEAGATLRRRKRELRVLSYDDMLLQLHERLSAVPALAEALRERFPAALVDEFQDTDPLQWSIVQRIWGGGGSPLLLVGDPKQAIYGFRNADLHTYLRARGSAGAVYSLTHNQRSCPALIDALNTLFQAHGRTFLLPGLEHAPQGVGDRPRPVFVDGTAAVGDTGALQLWALPRAEHGEPLLREAALRAAVQATAGEIARLLREGRAGRVTLDGRPLAGSDIAVLVRTHAQGALVRQALAALGVGSVALSQASVFHTAEAEELHHVLAAVLEPQHPGRQRAALATTLMGGDAAALEALAQDEAALSAHHERFAAWQACWLEQGIAALLRRWQREAGVAQQLLARPDGARRLTNLRHLGERLHEAAAQHAAPRALLRWLAARRRARGVDEADQLRLESDQPLVRVVTIHKAKGLEYGLVFCPLLWDALTPPTASGGLVEARDAHGHPVLELRAGLDPACDEAALRRELRLEQAAETLRLIYVALTRAVHRCYLVVGPYAARSGRGVSLQAGTRGMLNWLAAGEAVDDAAAWFEHRLAAEDIEAAWRRLASRCGAIRLAPLPMASSAPLPAAPAPACAALPPPRRIAPGWQVVDDGATAWEPVADEHAWAAPDRPEVLALPRDDVLRFPRGALAEDALHAALAQADVGDPASWDAAVREALWACPLPGLSGPGGEGRERALAAMLRRMLEDVLDTELMTGLQLRGLASGRHLRNMEFHLPAHAPAGGFVHGVMDLVFEHEGRWWVLSWKPDWLGAEPADYADEALACAAQAHTPQLRLQAVALERWLGRRVPGYRRETHLGGALLLFVRGVRPAWRQADGSACGVFQTGAAELFG